MSKLDALATDEAMQVRRRAVADPTRMRILGLLGDSDGGMTANELGDRLAMNPNRLYYHLRMLEEAGVIGVVDTARIRTDGRARLRPDLPRSLHLGRRETGRARDAPRRNARGRAHGSRGSAVRTSSTDRIERRAAGRRVVGTAIVRDDARGGRRVREANRCAPDGVSRTRATMPDDVRTSRLRFTWLLYEQDAPRSP